jgi:hypothetical protein
MNAAFTATDVPPIRVEIAYPAGNSECMKRKFDSLTAYESLGEQNDDRD